MGIVQKYAMQMAATAEESAATLLLETDPTTRMPRKFYEVWYQKLALRETEQALRNVERLQEELGSEWESAVNEYGGKFSVLCAEARLQHDTLYQVIRYALCFVHAMSVLGHTSTKVLVLCINNTFYIWITTCIAGKMRRNYQMIKSIVRSSDGCLL